MKNIMLIGMSGAGKSTLGKMVAANLGLTFVDMDTYIEKKLKMPVAEIFSKMGEGYFRGLESAAAAILSRKQGQVIATGGGYILRENNLMEAKKTSVLILIDRLPQNILKDFDFFLHPLIKNETEFLKLYNERKTIYMQAADYILNADDSLNQVVEQLCLMIVTEFLHAPHFAVIGRPIENSLSPQIHLPLLRHYCENPSYERINLEDEGLTDFVAQVKQSGMDGFNVTMPFKRAILPLLDYIDEEARLIGAVNTVINKSGKLCGFNTDGVGFYMAMQHLGVDLRGKTLLLLGIGGAARAIAFNVVRMQIAEIIILNQEPELADALCAEIRLIAPTVIIKSGSLQDINANVKGVDILINATPLGMEHMPQWQSLDFIDLLPKTAFVYDVVYQPEKTLLLQNAAMRGLQTDNGLSMLIFQALEADSIYLGISLDVEEMYEKIKLTLKLSKEGLLC